MYGLPKTHKDKVPLRSIVNTGSPPCVLAKYLANKLVSLVGHMSSLIKYLTYFINNTKEIKVEECDILTGFGITSLYIRFLINGVIEVIRGFSNP